MQSFNKFCDFIHGKMQKTHKTSQTKQLQHSRQLDTNRADFDNKSLTKSLTFWC